MVWREMDFIISKEEKDKDQEIRDKIIPKEKHVNKVNKLDDNFKKLWNGKKKRKWRRK